MSNRIQYQELVKNLDLDINEEQTEYLAMFHEAIEGLQHYGWTEKFFYGEIPEDKFS